MKLLERRLRRGAVHRVVRGVLRALHAARDDFRVIAYSLQASHLHLITEADDAGALGSGARALTIRLGIRLNRVLGRSGRLFADTYHRHDLTSPREVRNALAYVLLNHRRHRAQRGFSQRCGTVDAFSSAEWFDGWTIRLRTAREPPAVASPRTWLGRRGWRKHGPISPFEIPGKPRGSPTKRQEAPPRARARARSPAEP